MDRLIVKNIEEVNGEYEFDIVTLLTEGHPDSLTSREGHRIKVLTGIRAGELTDAVQAGDSDVLLAIAAIVLTRSGKQYDDDALWDAPMGAFAFDLSDRDAEDKTNPPVSALDERPPTVEPATNGGDSSKPGSEFPAGKLPLRTGHPDSPEPVTSPQRTSAT